MVKVNPLEIVNKKKRRVMRSGFYINTNLREIPSHCSERFGVDSITSTGSIGSLDSVRLKRGLKNDSS